VGGGSEAVTEKVEPEGAAAGEEEGGKKKKKKKKKKGGGGDGGGAAEGRDPDFLHPTSNPTGEEFYQVLLYVYL